jgi:hypothetical protein
VANLHEVDVTALTMDVYVCDADGDNIRDDSLQTTVPVFYARCPNTLNNQSPRKLVWVEAELQAPLYFLHLLGFASVPLHTNAIAEAAPVDVVVVLDISESMASTTLGTLCAPYGGDCPFVDNYDPNDGSVGCNPTVTYPNGTCQPLLDAKIAINGLIDNMYNGYDRIAIVTFDQVAQVKPILNEVGTQDVNISGNLVNAKTRIAAIRLHDDPPAARMWPNWIWNKTYNPANPEDRDGNGLDADPNLPPCSVNPTHPNCCNLDADRWDEVKGVPCDSDTENDAYDWDGDGVYTAADTTGINDWLTANDPDGAGGIGITDSPLSTCTGCGIRIASELLKTSGRPTAVWVMIVLSDGVANLSDTPQTTTRIPDEYPNGFCTGTLGTSFWRRNCIDTALTPRYCIDTASTTCPPSTTWQGTIPNNNYSVMDYARDMIDETGLLRSGNAQEPLGNDIAIFTIGLGAAGYPVSGGGAIGEELLRYMASVGDDGDRQTDLCTLTPAQRNCGTYYYAPVGDQLVQIFEDIATRIYTRITD